MNSRQAAISWGPFPARISYCTYSGVIETSWWITQCKHQNIQQMKEEKNDKNGTYSETSTSVILDCVELGEQHNETQRIWTRLKNSKRNEKT